ncbi:GntR family transcriptional regulator [Streptomyces sp. KhCrAH-43]|uniref:GntR family transcriptional regulator n=1 Tax=unclassified Streptomyces TaxID=2593676 RepID=UPI0003A526BD|nr:MULTISPECIES: GntR family transcriptional regulator [unclassified Streptomyces]RAJ61020.1 GntR family transcriptional regulator [Streptomyces sp. KhCrAH-43]
MRYYIERRRGVAAYQQIVEQTKRAVRAGVLKPGDRLPTAREVAETCAVNPNTTLKAYRELDRDGVVELRQGVGTFIAAAAGTDSGHETAAASPLYAELARWIGQALGAGLVEEDVRDMVELALHADRTRRQAAAGGRDGGRG